MENILSGAISLISLAHPSLRPTLKLGEEGIDDDTRIIQKGTGDGKKDKRFVNDLL